MADWAEAGRVAGIGFGVVFFVLVVLALAIAAVGLVLRRLGGPTSNSPGPRGDRK